MDWQKEIVGAIRKHLLGVPAISNVVGGRVYNSLAPEAKRNSENQTDLPMIVMHRIVGPRATNMTGSAGLAQTRVQLECWGAKLKDGYAVLGLVMGELQGYQGTMNDTKPEAVAVDHVLFQDDPVPVYDDQRRAHGVRVDMIVAHGGL